MAAADVRWMLELLTPRIVQGRAARHVELGLDPAVLARCEKLVVKALQDGRQRTRGELMTLLERAGISTAQQRGYVVLWHLAHAGVICFACPQGKQPAFALLEEWVPKARRLGRDEALAELALRYFTGHGPATVHDFVWWSGLKVADAKAGLALVSPQLAEERVEGAVYWMPRNTPDLRDTAPTAYLLPGFDEFLLGYTDRAAVLDPRQAQKVAPGGNGVFKPTIVVDGRVAGLWRHAVKKNVVLITPTPFTRFKKSETSALAARVARYGQFQRLSAALAKH